MLTLTAKAPKRSFWIALVLMSCAGVLCVLLALSAARQEQGPAYSTAADSPASCAKFLAQFGWETDPDSATEKSVQIPAVFDTVYEDYNTIQKAQGLDLTLYKGQSATLITLPVTNYPDYNEPVFANLLLINGHVVGGDISASRLDGFMHGFDLTGTGLPFGQYTVS